MKNKYSVNKLHICTLEDLGNKYIKPNLNQFPDTRLCLIDNEKGIAIDVLHKLKYDYLETVSMLYLINGASKKIRQNKRVAIFPHRVIDLTEDENYRIKDIVNKLENNYIFCDGNDVYNNDEYLEQLEKEKQDYINGSTVKKLIRRKK